MKVEKTPHRSLGPLEQGDAFSGSGRSRSGRSRRVVLVVTVRLIKVARVKVGGELGDVGVAADVDEEEGGVEVGMETVTLHSIFTTDIIMHGVLVRTVNSCPPKHSCIGSWQCCHGNNVILPYFR